MDVAADDHARLERLAFDGVPAPDRAGALHPDRNRPGLGVTVTDADLAPYRMGIGSSGARRRDGGRRGPRAVPAPGTNDVGPSPQAHSTNAIVPT
jgi:hypothetical protein